MKGIGIHPEPTCCFLCSLQSNANGYGKRDLPLFVCVCICVCFVLTSPSLCSRNWRLENTAAPGISPTASFFFFLKVRLALMLDCVWLPKSISGSALVVKDGIQNGFSAFRVFSAFQFQASATHTWTVCEREKVTEMIPGIDAVKLYSNILCLLTMYIWCLNSFSFCENEATQVSLTSSCFCFSFIFLF